MDKQRTKAKIRVYLRAVHKTADFNILFDTNLPKEKRHRMISQLFNVVAGHHLEDGNLCVDQDTSSEIKINYWYYNNYDHLTSMTDLVSELEAVGNVMTSIRNVEVEHHKILHRNKEKETELKKTKEKSKGQDLKH